MKKSTFASTLVVIFFIIVLTIMYELVANDNPISGINGEKNELNLVGNIKSFSTGIANNQMQFIHHTQPFSAGVGNGTIQLINQNSINTYMGLDLKEINKNLASELKLPANTGIYINSVFPESPGKKAGIVAGDALLKCDHKPVNKRDQVFRILQSKKAGDVIKVLIQRNGRKKSFHVRLEKPPGGLIKVAAKATSSPTWMGADIQNIDAVMKMQFKLNDQKGVIVSHITPDSPAAHSGLKIGDVIRRFQGTRILDVKQLQALILKGQPGKQIRLTVLRDGNFNTLPIVLGQRSPKQEKIPFLSPADIAIEGTWIGMDVGELSPNDATALGLPSGTRGIMVNDVESPPALSLGFQTGDVITSINSIPTPDMKHFVLATKHQQSAVVELIRGNKHMFVSVPPPGYTRQGNKIYTGNTNFQKVTANAPLFKRIAIFVDSPNLTANISSNLYQQPFIILIDLSMQSYAVLDQNNAHALAQTLADQQVSALICSNISRSSANSLMANGVTIYNGTVGTALDAINLYESSQLIAMQQ
jgi:S1-C subfamily serine protease